MSVTSIGTSWYQILKFLLPLAKSLSVSGFYYKMGFPPGRANTVLLSLCTEKVESDKNVPSLSPYKLACLAGSCALVMEKVIQQFIVRPGNNVDVIVAHQEAGPAPAL